MHSFLFIKTRILKKLYNREMDMEKWGSSGDAYLLLNGQDTVNMSLTKLKACD